MLPVIGASAMRSESERLAFFRCAFVVVLDETSPKHQDIADLNVTTLSFGSDVDPLGGSAALEFLEWDCVGFVRVIFDIVGVGIGAVIDKDAASGDTVVCPVVDATFLIGIRTGDIVSFCLGGMLAACILQLQYWALTPL
jgi:hypothetical protein